MFDCKLKVKDKILFILFVVMLLVMSFAAGNYYRSLWVFFGVFIMGLFTVIVAIKKECEEEQNKHEV